MTSREAAPRRSAPLGFASRHPRLGAALGAIGRRPRAAADLWQLWEHAVVDGRALAAALADLCGSLPESGSVAE